MSELKVAKETGVVQQQVLLDYKLLAALFENVCSIIYRVMLTRSIWKILTQNILLKK